MRTSLLLLAAAITAAAAIGQAPWPLLSARPLPLHSQAAINDPRSHGVVGDRLLSLAEAILLTNRDIDENALSAEEVAQLSGFGGDIAWADINAAVVPVITLERNLPVIRDTPHGFQITGSNGLPVIELGDTRGIVARSDFFDVWEVKLRGGEQGIHLTQFDAIYGSTFEGVVFEGHGVVGLRVTLAQPGGNSRVQIAGCRFDNLRTGVLVEDLGDARSGRLEVFGGTRLNGCDVGIDLRLGRSGSLTVWANRVIATGCGEALRIAGAGGAPRRALVLEGRYLRLDGTRAAMMIDGDPLARTLLLLQQLDLTSPATALAIGDTGDFVDLTLQDSRLTGRTRLAGGTSGKILVENVEVDGGSLTLEASGAPITVGQSVLDGAAILSLGSSPVRILGSRAIGGTLAGTASAPMAFEDGHTSGTSIGAHVSVLRPLPAPQLGVFDAAPLEPLVGTPVVVSVALPARLQGYLLFGQTADAPAPLGAGLRVYADAGALAMLPSTLTGTNQVTIPIPAVPALSGLDLFFHLAVAPQPGTIAPPLAMPPGRRVRVR